MSTISQNNIVVNYVITSDQIAKTKTEFDKLTDAEKKAVDETKKLNDQLKKTGQEGGQSVKGVGNEMNNLSGIVKSGAGLLAGFFAVSKIQEFTQKLFTTTAAFESLRTTIDYATQGQVKSGEAFQYLTNLANKYGKDLQSLAGVYSSFTASSNLAGIKLNESNKIFEAAVKASTALGKSNQDTQGILLAFSQIVSKGTVQAEELRGQIGERIPGAFNLAAKAMGVTTRELNKMLEQGQVISAEFLPKFAVELEKAFGSAAEAKINSMAASLGRFTTAWDKFLESPLIGKYLAETLNLFTVTLNEIRKLTMTEAQRNEEIFQKNISNIQENAKKEVEITKQKYNEVNNAKATSGAIAQGLLNKDEKAYKELLDRVKFYNLEVDKRTLEYVEARRKILKEIIADQNKENDGKIKKIGLTDAELKALKAQYDAKLKLLELDRKQRELQGTLANDPNAKLAAEISFLDAKATLQTKYAAKGLAITKQEIDITKKESQVAEKELNERFKIQQMETYKVVETTEKEKEKARKASMDQTVKDNKEMIDAVNKEADDLAKKEFDRIKAIEEARQEANQQAFDLAVFSTNAIFDIQSQYAANDFARKQKQFDEEIRLADGNIQKETEINEKRAAAEKEYRLKEFRANQVQSVANAVFAAAPYIIKYSAGLPITAANLSLTLFALAAQTTAIMAQPPPEFAEGTKGKKYKGRAIVGERGTEKVVTQSGRVYYTPPVATLAQFDEPVEIIPNHQLGLNDRKQLSLIYGNRSTSSDSGGKIIEKLSNIEIGLKNMPVAAISLDERGFMKKVRTPNRSTTILNNRFKN